MRSARLELRITPLLFRLKSITNLQLSLFYYSGIGRARLNFVTNDVGFRPTATFQLDPSPMHTAMPQKWPRTHNTIENQHSCRDRVATQLIDYIEPSSSRHRFLAGIQENQKVTPIANLNLVVLVARSDKLVLWQSAHAIWMIDYNCRVRVEMHNQIPIRSKSQQQQQTVWFILFYGGDSLPKRNYRQHFGGRQSFLQSGNRNKVLRQQKWFVK